MTLWLLLPVVAGFSLLLTGVLRRYAVARSILDHPNARSSHSTPTPRGGGLAIVVGFLAALLLLDGGGEPGRGVLSALLGAGLGIALLGFIDDHGHIIAARWRLLGHFVAAAWVLHCLGGMPPLHALGTALELGWLGYPLGALYLVWLLNLYNFMDGIDGIASIEAICTCLGGALLLILTGNVPGALQPLLLAAAVLGFLFWNFPPARIFMGDAGSGFLGIALGALSLHAAWHAPQLWWSWLILLGVFIVDASWTLLRRLWRRERLYLAHRSHAYQHAARRHGGHLPVSLAVGAINLFWLLPLALGVALGKLDGLVGLLVAWMPLWLLAMRYRAGEAERSHDTA